MQAPRRLLHAFQEKPPWSVPLVLMCIGTASATHTGGRAARGSHRGSVFCSWDEISGDGWTCDVCAEENRAASGSADRLLPNVRRLSSAVFLSILLDFPHGLAQLTPFALGRLLVVAVSFDIPREAFTLA